MGWSFRKSKSFGPFRLNFSKSGLGLSFGVNGARISTSHRGTFVTLGANGIYYRQHINNIHGKSGNNHSISNDIPSPIYAIKQPRIISTQAIEGVTDVESQAFIRELEEKGKKVALLKLIGIWPSVFIMLYLIGFCFSTADIDKQYIKTFTITKGHVLVRSGPSKEYHAVDRAKKNDKYVLITEDSSGWAQVYLPTDSSYGFVRSDMGQSADELIKQTDIKRIDKYPSLGLILLISPILLTAFCFYLKDVDKKRKTLELKYILDSDMSSLHEKFLNFFKEFTGSNKIWQNLYVQRNTDLKRNSGAAKSVLRTTIQQVYNHNLPSPFLKTNVRIPCIKLKNIELYFFPERLILKRDNKFGAAFYKNITITSNNVRFIEEDPLPADAEIVDYTWQYPNKDGGPDRRFSNNRQIPICLYTEYNFTSDNGINEVITTSKTGGMDNFARFLIALGKFQQTLN